MTPLRIASGVLALLIAITGICLLCCFYIRPFFLLDIVCVLMFHPREIPDTKHVVKPLVIQKNAGIQRGNAGFKGRKRRNLGLQRSC